MLRQTNEFISRHLPDDQLELFTWCFLVALLYFVVAYIIRSFHRRGDYTDGTFFGGTCFNCATFSIGSLAVFTPIKPSLLVVVGEAPILIMIAGIAALGYCLYHVIRQ